MKMLSFIASRSPKLSVSESSKFLASNYIRIIIAIFLSLHFLYLYVSHDSQQINFAIQARTQKQVSLETRRIEQNEMKLRCMRESWSPRPDTHPGAPIHSLPKGIPDLELTFHFHIETLSNLSEWLKKLN